MTRVAFFAVAPPIGGADGPDGPAFAVFQLATGLPLGIFMPEQTVHRPLTEIFVTLPMIFPPMALGFSCCLCWGKTAFWVRCSGAFFSLNLFFRLGPVNCIVCGGLPFMVKSVQSSCRN
jgi:molybdate transport system permease protein